MRVTMRFAAVAVVVVATLAFGAPRAVAQALSATDKEKIGLTALNNRLGAAAPTGAGVTANQVEAPLTPLGNNYRPDPTNSQFASDTITPKTAGGTTSTHALAVGQAWYGSGGVSPGVSQIDVYNANSWQTGTLRLGSQFAPLTEPRDIQNHSWAGNFGSSTDALKAIARLDLVAQRDNVVVVSAVNNGSGTLLPQFPTSMYNGIAVGLTSGASSPGPTTLDFGRSKPDLVAPTSLTSIAAPWVSGAAAILLQTAGANANAARNTTIKAVLLAGATKNEFDLNQTTVTTLDDWSHSTTQPLDDRFGAGELNIDNSHRILASGEQAASDTVGVGLTGWDVGTASTTDLQQYFFTIPTGRVAQTVSIIATWNREIDFTIGSGGSEGTLTPTMADMDLALSKSQGFSTGNPVAASISTVDNVEHIFVRGLTAGQYAIALPTNQSWAYSLAWDVLLAVPGDGNGDRIVDAADYTIWADHFLMTDATLDDGDFNGDGIVDAADYTLWADNFSPFPAVATMAIPEPSGVALLAIALATLIVGSIYQRLRRRLRTAS